MRHFREAQAILEALAAQRPGDLMARDYLAWCLSIGPLEMRAGDHDAAPLSPEGAGNPPGLAAGRPDDLEWQMYLANTLHDLGMRAGTIGHGEEALGVYRQALELTKKLSDAHPELSRLQDSLAAIYNDMANVARIPGRRAARGEAFVRGVIGDSREPGPGSSHCQPHEETIGDEHYNIGLFLATRAVGTMQPTLSTSPGGRRRAPADQSFGCHYRQNLAKTCSAWPTSAPARAVDRVGRRIPGRARRLERLPRAEPSNAEYRKSLADCLVGSARLLETEGKLDEALASHREAVEFLRTLVQDRPQVVPFRDQLAASQFSLADCLAATGRLDLARQVQHEALATRLSWFGRSPASMLTRICSPTDTVVARLEVEAGRSGEALWLLEQAGAI